MSPYVPAPLPKRWYISNIHVPCICKPIFVNYLDLHFYNFLPSLEQNKNLILTKSWNLKIEIFLIRTKIFKIFSMILLGMFCDISSSCGCLKGPINPFFKKCILLPYLSMDNLHTGQLGHHFFSDK